jgi:hypothetical protein
MPPGGIAILVFPLAGTFYPEPARPSSILSYLAVGRGPARPPDRERWCEILGSDDSK